MNTAIDSEHYLEKALIINGREIKYKGIYRADELFTAINQALEQHGYEKREKKSEETVSDSGRRTYVELRPYKNVSNYVRLMIKIKIMLDNTTETAEVINGEKRLYQNGDVIITFDAWSLTDYANRWSMKPWAFFMKGIIHKFVKKFPLESGFTGELVKDTAHIYAKVKFLLNSYKVETGKLTTEDDIKKQVEMQLMSELDDNIKEM
ncbi:MAG: hypothetical protein WCV90_00560 [Candidatus Woesearchaeota archaeon]